MHLRYNCNECVRFPSISLAALLIITQSHIVLWMCIPFCKMICISRNFSWHFTITRNTNTHARSHSAVAEWNKSAVISFEIFYCIPMRNAFFFRSKVRVCVAHSCKMYIICGLEWIKVAYIKVYTVELIHKMKIWFELVTGLTSIYIHFLFCGMSPLVDQ